MGYSPERNRQESLEDTQDQRQSSMASEGQAAVTLTLSLKETYSRTIVLLANKQRVLVL